MPSQHKNNKYRTLSSINPRFSEDAVRDVLNGFISPINRVLCRGTVFELSIPYLGVIKTHGNRRKKISAARKKYQKKYHKKRNQKKIYTKEELLFK